MADHLSNQDIEKCRAGTLPIAVRLAAANHLATCDSCYKRFGDGELLQATWAFFQADLEAPHGAVDDFLYTTLAAYVDEELDGEQRRALEFHLETCSQCRAELRDLHEMKAAVRPGQACAPGPSVGSGRTWRSFWRWAVRPIPLPFAGAAFLMLLLAWLATIPLRTEVATLREQLAEAQGAKPGSQSEAGPAAELERRLDEMQRENDRLRLDAERARGIAAEMESRLRNRRRPGQSNGSPRIVLALSDNGVNVTLDEQGTLRGLKPLPSAYHAAVTEAISRQRVRTPRVLAGLIGKAETVMGGQIKSGSFALLSPVGTVVEGDRPTLRWSALSKATSYTVAVIDSNFIKVAASLPLSATEWTLPVSLGRGAVYSWQVRAVVEGKEVVMPPMRSPSARFKVLESEKAGELAHARESYEGSHLVLGVLYARAGLLDDAEREFDALAAANPGSLPVRRLLWNLRALRGR